MKRHLQSISAASVMLVLGSTASVAHDLRGALFQLDAGADEQIRAAAAQAPTAELRSVVNNLQLWPTPHILTICFIGGHKALRQKITGVMRAAWPLNSLGDVQLQFDKTTFDNPPDCGATPKYDIRVAFGPTGYWSYVGVESRLHNPSMNFQDFDTDPPPDKEFYRIIAHEAGHMLALEHEHQSPAVPTCDWNFDYIYTHYQWQNRDDMYANFQKLVDKIISKNMHAYTFSIYDQKSIMHYAFEEAAYKDGSKDLCYIEQNYRPSDQDLSAIEVAYARTPVGSRVPSRGFTPGDDVSWLSDSTFDRVRAVMAAKAEVMKLDQEGAAAEVTKP